MFKKLLIAIGVIITIIAVLIIVAGFIVYNKVDKTFISSQMSKALNRQVYIEKIDVNIFPFFPELKLKMLSFLILRRRRSLRICRANRLYQIFLPAWNLCASR